MGTNIFHRQQTFPFERKDLAQSFRGSPIFKAKCARSKAKSPQSKSRDKRVVLCYPRALKMPLYKECKKLIISSSSPIIIISHFRFPPSLRAKFPPHLFPPMGGHDNAKGHKKISTVLRSRSDWKRGSVGFLSRIFSPNRDDF